MKVRVVIELYYPAADGDADETLIKEKLSAEMIRLAREKEFDVSETLKVDEVMVGCARIPDVVTSG